MLNYESPRAATRLVQWLFHRGQSPAREIRRRRVLAVPTSCGCQESLPPLCQCSISEQEQILWETGDSQSAAVLRSAC